VLRNKRCPENLVVSHLLSRSARVRFAALRATQRRTLAIDSALIRSARDLPMTEKTNTTYPYTERVKKLAGEILDARCPGP
jgi:hypothetical protein